MNIQIGEEANKPKRAVPISIITSVIICFVVYAGVAGTTTLIAPFFLLNPKAPLTDVFRQAGLEWANYMIYLGAFCALVTSILGNSK